MSQESNLRKLIVDVGNWLYHRQLIVAGDGNISTRLGNLFLCTPAGMCKGRLHADDLLVVDKSGLVIEGRHKPSSELKMHLKVYEKRGDANAVVHAHPPHATAFACCGKGLTEALLPEMILTLGYVPLAQYGTPSTQQVAINIDQLISSHDALLLANHGAITIGKNLLTAYHHMETIEHFAKIAHLANSIGNPVLLTSQQVEEIKKIMEQKGTMPKALQGDSDFLITSDG